ncbi:MAG: DUF4336 domain-containing protein [Erythrobacter sp.]
MSEVGSPGYTPYQPQLIPVARGADLWTVEGPEVRYRFAGLHVPCPTRMTVVRLRDGSLWIHSPVQLTPQLASDLAKIGAVSVLIAPNRNHFLSLAQWAGAYPDAQVFAAPGLSDRTGVPPHETLSEGLAIPWADEIAHITFLLGDFTEVVFFHRKSRTLVVTGLMMNYESGRICNLLMRLFLKLGGATGPRGNPSIDMRTALRPYRSQLEAGLRRAIDYAPEQIILAHGQCYERDAVAEIGRAFPFVHRIVGKSG